MKPASSFGFERDGVLFHYREAGEGLPFVFQHGLGGNTGQTFGIFSPPPGVRLLTLDCRGHGETSGPQDPAKLHLSVFTADVAAWLDSLGIGRAVVGGISMGAAVALDFAMRHPDRVAALILSRPAWFEAPNPWNVKMFSLVADLLRRHGPFEGFARFEATAEYRETKAQFPDTAKSLAGQFANPRALDNIANLEQIPRDRPDFPPASWAAIRVPTLVLANDRDPIHPLEYGQKIAAAIPGAEFLQIASKSESVERHNQDTQRALSEFLLRHFPGLR